MPQFFIKRPHAIDKFRERSGYDNVIDNIRLEAIIRNELEKQAEDPTNFLPSRKDGEFVIRFGHSAEESRLRSFDPRAGYQGV